MREQTCEAQNLTGSLQCFGSGIQKVFPDSPLPKLPGHAGGGLGAGFESSQCLQAPARYPQEISTW